MTGRRWKSVPMIAGYRDRGADGREDLPAGAARGFSVFNIR